MLAFLAQTSTMFVRTSTARTTLLSPHSSPSRTFLSSFLVGRRRTRRAQWRFSMPTMTLEAALPLEEERDAGKVEGTNLRVLRYPHPALRAENEEVKEGEFDEGLKRLSREMFDVMYACRGVGLAAPQVGVNKRLMVFNPDSNAKGFLQEVVLVNPQIVGKSKKTVVEDEACLSFPGMSGGVSRHEWVKVEARRLNGKKFKVKYEGWVARIFQHEYDHLDGVVYVDKIESEEDQEEVKDRLAQLVQEYNEDVENKGRAAAL